MYYKRLSYSVSNYINLFDNMFTYFNSLTTYSVLLRNCGTAGIRKEFYLSRNNKFFSFSNTIHIQNIVSNLSEANDTNFNSDSTNFYGTGSFTACLNNEFNTARYYGNQLKCGDNIDSKLAVFCSLPKDPDSQIDVEIYSDRNNYNFIFIFNFFIDSKKYTQYILFGDMFNGLYIDKHGGYVIGTLIDDFSAPVLLPKDYNLNTNIVNAVINGLPLINLNDNFYNQNNIIANIKFKNGDYLTRQNIITDQYLLSNFNIYQDTDSKNYIGMSNILSLSNEKNGIFFLENLELHSAYEVSMGSIQSYSFVKQFNFGICNNAIFLELPYRKVNDKYYRILKTCHSDKNNFRSIYHRGLAFFIEITKEEYEANI